jgi:hypothetical protein
MPLNGLERRYVLAVKRLVHGRDAEIARLAESEVSDILAVMDVDGQPRGLREFALACQVLSNQTAEAVSEPEEQKSQPDLPEPLKLVLPADIIDHPGKMARTLAGCFMQSRAEGPPPPGGIADARAS